jgi:hypothetical protein
MRLKPIESREVSGRPALSTNTVGANEPLHFSETNRAGDRPGTNWRHTQLFSFNSSLVQTPPSSKSARLSLKIMPEVVAMTVLLLADNTFGTDTNSVSVSAEEPATNLWSFSVAANGYLVPDSRDYVQPTATADRGWLHLETRYNYENLDTGSIWAGYNFSNGEKLAWQLTPILGGVFGKTTGIAPGYEGTLTWWKLELYSEGEFVVDPSDSSKNYFYNWSELTLAPVEWLRFGMVTQRTRTYRTDRDIQRGFLVGVSYRKVSFTTYVLNADEHKPVIVLGAGVTF